MSGCTGNVAGMFLVLSRLYVEFVLSRLVLLPPRSDSWSSARVLSRNVSSLFDSFVVTQDPLEPLFR